MFFNPGVTAVCPVTTDLNVRVNVRTTAILLDYILLLLLLCYLLLLLLLHEFINEISQPHACMHTSLTCGVHMEPLTYPDVGHSAGRPRQILPPDRPDKNKFFGADPWDPFFYLFFFPFLLFLLFSSFPGLSSPL